MDPLRWGRLRGGMAVAAVLLLVPLAPAVAQQPVANLAISPASDSASSGNCNPFTITATSSGGQPVSGRTVDVEQVHEFVAGGGAPTVSFCVPVTGPNPSAVDTARGDLVESPDERGTAGGETVQATDAQGQVTIGVAIAEGGGTGPFGRVTVTAFVETNDNDDPDQGEPQATATKTWVVAEGRTIDCEPETATLQTGATHTVTCTVRDRFGETIVGEDVTFLESGPGRLTSAAQVATNAQGTVQATFTSTLGGRQDIRGVITDELVATSPGEVDECDRAAGDPAGAPQGVCSDRVVVVWTVPSGGSAMPKFCTDNPNAIIGTDGPDVIEGTGRQDIVCARGGNDRIVGFGGDDIVFGGAGDDVIGGGRGGDALFGGRGDDVIRGGRGADFLKGNAGKDQVRGGAGEDVALGNRNNDLVLGGADDDGLVGGRGFDTLRGGDGRDTLRGAKGNDVLRGGADVDGLAGGDGDDLLNGGRNRDVCRGGRGSDTFRNCENHD